LTNNTRRIETILSSLVLLLFLAPFASGQVTAHNDATPFHVDNYHPLEIGAIIQGGFGVTEDRDDFKFFMAGAHIGKVIAASHGHSAFRSNFELAGEFFPFWQSYTPKFQRPFCTNPPGTPPVCTPFYTVGGTFTGMSITPIIFRWNLAGTKHFSFWGQAAGGLLWTNHKYPAFGGPPYNEQNDGPNADAAGRHRRSLLHPPPSLHRLRRQRRPHLQRLAWRPQPRRQRKRTILPRLHLVEITSF
jgi:lipid A 3-O-deacylase